MNKQSIIISADNIKETLSGYNPRKSGDFHRESTRIADKEYIKAIESYDAIKDVILLSGGSASGKTEYLSAYLSDKNAIIFDGTLPSIDGFKIKYKKALKYNKKIQIHSVIPDNLVRAFNAFLGRERKYDTKYFYKTHSQSRSTLLEIAKNYKDVDITLIISYFTNGKKMKFKKLIYPNKKALIEYLKFIQYNEKSVIKLISES